MIEQSYVLEAPPSLPRTNSASRLPTSLPWLNLARLRNEALRQALATTRGHKGRAAKLLGVHPNTLTRLLSQHDLSDADPLSHDHAAIA